MNQLLTVIGYSIAIAAFLILLTILLIGWRDRLKGSLLPLALLASAIWAGLLAAAPTTLQLNVFHIFLIEIGNDAAWLLFLSSLMSGVLSSERVWLMRYGGVMLALAFLLLGGWMEFFGDPNTGGAQLLVMSSLATSLYGLVAIEQIYRNARPAQRNGLKFLGLGVGGMFGFDLFLYSDAVISGGISPLPWSARGYVVALCVPLIAIAVRRIPSWSGGIFVSRQIVFYSATLIGVGIYLIVVGFSGYLIRIYGSEWGPVAQLVFFSASVLGLLIVLMSEQTRAKIRVFFVKHFFENKYEYREEWLRLINTLTAHENSLPLRKRAIQALAQIIGTGHGYLWLLSDVDAQYRCVTSWNIQPKKAVLPKDESLIDFVSRSGWVVDVREIGEDPDRYESLDSQKISGEFVNAGFIIPLFHNAELLGFVELPRPSTPFELNFEDHDLLKTAGQQIASYLAQELSTEQLAESRQFEAFNRLTAYIMHDLKNAMTQQALVVENAEIHKRNPAFVDDAIETIKGSVNRMRRVMGHLQQRGVEHQPENIHVGKLLLEIVSHCDDRTPLPSASIVEEAVWVSADRDRLYMALYHAIRNSQDATQADGVINIELSSTDTEVVISVSDNGRGMDEEFVRERLFKPFDSTKGAQGMGIGAYQIRETINGAGGDLLVESVPDEGTTLTITLPRAQRIRDEDPK